MWDETIQPRENWLNDRRFFFKYVSTETALAVLTNRKLRYSTPGLLNDPYDLQFAIRFAPDFERAKSATLRKLWDAHYGAEQPVVGNALGRIIAATRSRFPRMSRDEFDHQYGRAIDAGFGSMMRRLPQFRDEIAGYMANVKVLCLTASPDNLLMWSHYAQNHQGIVLQFESKPERDSVFGIAQPVDYVDAVPEFVTEDFLSDLFSGRVAFDVPNLFQRLVFTKGGEWRYENEWRVCSGEGRQPGTPFEDGGFFQDELHSVIFGTRSTEAFRNQIVELVSEHFPQTRILNARLAQDRFGMEFEETIL